MSSWKNRRGTRLSASLLGPRLGAAFVGALTAYCILSTLVGPAGLVAYGQLKERRVVMSENLKSLGRINEELRSRLDALTSDADKAAREARALGYLRPNETEVVLPGGDYSGPAPIDIGRVRPLLPPRTLSDAAIKATAFSIGLALFVLIVPRRRRNLRSAE
ncbi:MAG TPA: septum formation initiator family protein [Rectinemataceae bacterium]|nr:septum formation initiator family protein [Rectinemataceae bacterium]